MGWMGVALEMGRVNQIRRILTGPATSETFEVRSAVATKWRCLNSWTERAAISFCFALGAVIGCSVSVGPAAAAVPAPSSATAVPAGSQRSVPSAFFGFNAESSVLPIDARLMSSRALASRLAVMPGAILRIPGGTPSQWIDWRTGRLIDSPGSPFSTVDQDESALTLRDWTSIVRRTRATPLWDLNVLTSTLPDQLGMLRAARKLGLPVRFVELGNELWDPEAPYVARYPTGASYGAVMNPWITAIHRQFPKALIAVSGADESDPQLNGGGSRYLAWNQGVLSSVRGEDAIAIHPYWSLPNLQPPGSNVEATLTAGQAAWTSFAKSLSTLPPSLSVWLTEWNQTGRFTSGGVQIWAQALAVDAFALETLTNPQVTLSLLHDVVDGAKQPQDVSTSVVFPLFTDGSNGSPVLGRTAIGYAFPLLVQAVAGARKVKPLVFPGAPQVGGQTGVVGVELFGKNPGAFLVNLNAQAVTVTLPKPLELPLMMTALSARATAQPAWVPLDQVVTSTAKVSKSVLLPAYSVVQLLRR
jgi:hypothetical protein